jgi:hypothetical protein
VRPADVMRSDRLSGSHEGRRIEAQGFLHDPRVTRSFGSAVGAASTERSRPPASAANADCQSGALASSIQVQNKASAVVSCQATIIVDTWSVSNSS